MEKTNKIIVPNGTKRIEADTFINGEELTEIVLPESVEYIDKTAFYNCRALKKITLYASSISDILLSEFLDYFPNCDRNELFLDIVEPDIFDPTETQPFFTKELLDELKEMAKSLSEKEFEINEHDDEIKS